MDLSDAPSYNSGMSKWVLPMLGVIVGLVADAVTPFPQLILELENNILTSSSIGNYPGLSVVVEIGMRTFAFLALPIVGVALGLRLRNKL